MTEQKLTELLRDMSLEEKVNQMSQVTGGFFNGEIVVTGPMADKGFTEDNVNLAGSVIGSMGAETLKSIQKNYMEKHPHHIPLLFWELHCNHLHRVDLSLLYKHKVLHLFDASKVMPHWYLARLKKRYQLFDL